jgi:Cys-tRNA(Pro)/Cys-tRNA(Cys) deacylase
MGAIHTPITNLLDHHQVPYKVLLHREAVFTVDAAAQQRGVLKEEMVKSILLREKSSRRRYVMACVLGPDRLDPKAVRAYLDDTDWKRLTFASGEEIRAVTGSVKGAVAPLCLPAGVPVIFDHKIGTCAKVNISSGDPLAGLELAGPDLIRLAGAQLARISAPTT